MKEKRKSLDLPKVQKGYIRVFIDHTGRWYADYTIRQYQKMMQDLLVVILSEEIRKEVDREVINSIAMKALTT